MSAQDPFEEAPAGIGHNVAASNLVARLGQDYGALQDRATQLAAAYLEVPAQITDDDAGRKATDLVGLMKAAAKELDRNRVNEKEPFLTAERMVDQFFNRPREVIAKMVKEIEQRLAIWLQAKAAAEQRAREQKAAEEREAARRAFDDAVAAQQQETAATTRAAAAEAQAATAAMDLADARKAVEDAATAYRAAESAAVAARQQGNAKAYQAALNSQETARSKGTSARARCTDLLEAQREAEMRQQRADQEAAVASTASAKAMDTAVAADAAAAKRDKQAAAPIAELSRTRGDFSLSGLRKRMTFDGFDRMNLDLEALRHHLPAGGIEIAIRAFIKAGGTKLNGVYIYEETTAQVR